MADLDDTAGPAFLGIGECRVERPAAILIEWDQPAADTWIPKSVVHDDSEVWREGQRGRVVVAAWWAEQNPGKEGKGRAEGVLPLPQKAGEGLRGRGVGKMPLPMKPPTKKWLKDQAARMARGRKGRGA